MNVSMPAEIRHLVKQGAISTAALERETLDDSAWIVRAVCEKLAREWDLLEFREPIPDLVLSLAGSSLAADEGDVCEGPAAFARPGALPAVAA